MSSDHSNSNLWRAPFAPASPLKTTITIPGSKSMMARVLILAALSSSHTLIRRPLISRDSELMRDGLRALGVTIEEREDCWRVTPAHSSATDDADEASMAQHRATIDVGNAGTVMRFLPPVAALSRGEFHFDGDERSHDRPIAPVIKALESLGVRIEHEGRYAFPFTIYGSGQLRGGEIEIDASLSSQFVSSLLLAASAMEDGLTIRHIGPSLPSLPHIEMTVAMLKENGVVVESGQWWWKVQPQSADSKERIVEIEPDLSNAAPFLAAALLVGGTVAINDWPRETTQPGDALREIFTEMGGTFSWKEQVLGASKDSQLSGPLEISASGDRADLRGIDIDLSEVGELTPTIAALAAFASSPSHLRGIGHLRLHETDRLTALATELRKVGATVEEGADYLKIDPAKVLPTGPLTIATYDDHRIATLGALVGLMIEGTLVENIATTRKTITDFPALWNELLAGSRENSDQTEPHTQKESKER
jgi:3-phosphoshikimate 1-carboxyvinyltransferase